MFAYLDPASGSLILSAIAGGIAGLAVAFRSWRYRMKSKLLFWKSGDEPVEAADSSAQSPNESTPV